MKRVSGMIPTVRQGTGTTAFPPLGNPAPTMTEWKALRHNRPPLWRRLFSQPANKGASNG